MAQGKQLSNPAVAIPDGENQVRAFGHMLSMAQWLSPDEMEASQAQLVYKLLLHARRTTPFYKERLDIGLRSSADVKELWRRIPILTRAEAIQNRLKLVSRKSPRDMGPVSEGKTSGSTGTPFVFKKNAAMDIVATALTERMFRWWSMDGRKSLAQIASDGAREAPPPHGKTTYGWLSDQPSGAKHFIGMHTDADTHLRWLIGCRANYFGSYPAVLREMATMVRERGIELKFDQLFSFAAMLDQETRDLCRSVFGAEIADTYGTQEAGHIAAQCPGCGNYHISAEAMVVEVLRSDGSPAALGETGRVVVTPLYGYAMPLIRYALEDLAEVGPSPGPCGRGHPTLRRILGRARNMFRFRDGRIVWPVASSFRLAQFVSLKQFQVVQLDFDRIEVRYVPDVTGGPVDLPALTARMREVLRQPVQVQVRCVDRIERAAGGKLEECLSLVPDRT